MKKSSTLSRKFSTSLIYCLKGLIRDYTILVISLKPYPVFQYFMATLYFALPCTFNKYSNLHFFLWYLILPQQMCNSGTLTGTKSDMTCLQFPYIGQIGTFHEQADSKVL